MKATRWAFFLTVGLWGWVSILQVRADSPTDELTALRERAEAGENQARYQLGRLYLRGETMPRDLAEARRYLEPAAAAGHPEAMGAFGVMLARGLGMDADPGAGFDLVRKAAEAGVATAVLNQGIMTVRGQGTSADAAAGIALMERAAETGLVEAQVRLAETYYLGDEGRVPKSAEKAAPWALKAAEAGNAWAQTLVGTMKEHGLGMARDAAGALAFYRKAARQGNAKAQSALGRMLFGGPDIPPDRIEAYYWLRASAEQGEVTARTFLEETEGGFTREEREAGDKRLLESPPPGAEKSPRRGPGPPIPRDPAPVAPAQGR